MIKLNQDIINTIKKFSYISEKMEVTNPHNTKNFYIPTFKNDNEFVLGLGDAATFEESALYALSGGKIDTRVDEGKNLENSAPVVLNSISGGFRLSEEMINILGKDFDIHDRTHPKLVEVVKDLTEEQLTGYVYGMPCSLPCIDYIPINKFILRKWSIIAYDGQEKLKIE